MLPPLRDYDAFVRDFRWQVPARYNIGTDVCTRWALAEPDRVAILWKKPDGRVEPVTYGRLEDASNRLANVLVAKGVKRGDRVALVLAQGAAAAIAHIAIYKMGAIAVPLAALFGIDALAFRLANAGVRALITNAEGVAKLAQIRDGLGELSVVLSVDGAADGVDSFYGSLEQASGAFTAVDTAADDPAMMIYTSGTTGQPKGALHGHRVLLGHLPGVEMPHEFFPQAGDRMWTPADWAWAGGLLNVLLPSLHFGVPVVAHKFEKFDADEAFALMAELEVRNSFVPPTALRMLRSIDDPRARHRLVLRTLASGGEALGTPTYDWGRAALGLTINEFYGQTECNLVLASSAAIGVSKAGAIGKPVPGHTVGVIRDDGSLCAAGERGQIAVQRPDPVMFLEYWGRPEATRDKFIGDWMLTGDQGLRDEEGYVHFFGRDDDVITSAGYRIGPGEIEDTLLKHPAVSLAAAVGKPDELRTEIVKAFIVLKDGVEPSPDLAYHIRDFVRTRMSAHSYPREVEFIDELPMTTTGKIIRRLLRDRL
ncbi:AMP-binding protein [Phreatobacter cathodiphilus]|uniref:AMP-dependent synthetase n=1 Tax=Phreatobacter cathodiphilus TaxID=1868589 RepID=A0A2S0NDD2_9HYPH|nr:AMP-binding protein [Phreatobacter cathodiphilus]AVO46180.1 AMP-dependent synthetase [Phreatobacter cathodiphilus]